MTSDTVTSATKATRTPPSKGASRAVNQAASKATAKAARKAATKAVQNPAKKATKKAVNKAAQEVATKATTKTTSKPESKPTSKPTSKPKSKPTSKPATKPATQASSNAPSTAPTKAAKKVPAKSVTEAASKAVSAAPTPAASKPWHVVRRSPLHGNGIFAARKIPAGTRVLEYIGERISAKEADRRHPTNPDDPFHTFFFALSSGKVIDGGVGGNDARWINHSCTPNCESQEGRAGKRLYIVTLRDIARGEELFYDYGLVLDGKITKALKEGYKCLCGTPACRGTMLALPEKKKKKRAARSAA